MGQFSLVEANKLAPHLFEIIADKGIDRVLVDCSSLAGSITMMEQYQHAVYFAESLLANKTIRGIRFAYVATGAFADLEKFGETVAVNRGVNVRTFKDAEGAIQWLQKDSVGKL